MSTTEVKKLITKHFTYNAPYLGSILWALVPSYPRTNYTTNFFSYNAHLGSIVDALIPSYPRANDTTKLFTYNAPYLGSILWALVPSYPSTNYTTNSLPKCSWPDGRTEWGREWLCNGGYDFSLK